MSQIIHSQKVCRQQARQSSVTKKALNVLTPGPFETVVSGQGHKKHELYVARNKKEGLVVRVKALNPLTGRKEYCTVFQLFHGSVQKWHEPDYIGVDWIYRLEQWSNQTSLVNDFSCKIY